MAADTRQTARSFVHSLNILLKFARLYEFGHVRTMAQFETAWKELRTALDQGGDAGLLLGASGNQIVLDGVPLGAAAAEKSFAQLLTSSGIASIHFSPNTTQGNFARFVRAFPSGNNKPTMLAEQLKAALAGESNIKINEIRYVAEDGSVAGLKVAAQLTAKMLGGAGDKYRDVFEDPQKMLQLILAAESSRAGGSGGGGGSGAGHGGGGTGGAGGGTGSSWSGGTDSSGSLWDAGKASGGGGVGGVGGGVGTGVGGPGGGGSGTGGGSGFGGGGTGTGTGGSGGGSGLGGSGTSVGSGVGGGGGTGVGGSGGGGGSTEPGKWMSASAMLRGAMMGGVGVGTGGADGGNYSVAEEEVRSMIGLFAQLGKARKDPESRMDTATFQSRLTALPVRA